VTAVSTLPVPAGTGGTADEGSGAWAVTGLAWRQVRRGALVVTVLMGGMSALVVLTYRNTVGESLDVAALASLAANPAVRTLFGEPVALDDPGGFAVWRTGTVLAVLLGAWALLSAARFTRGEEDAGRWDLLLAGRLSLRTLVGCHVAVLVGVCTVAAVTVWAALIVAGTEMAGAVVHGAGLALTGAFFAGVGALAAQVFTTRAAAGGAAVAVLVCSLMVRMVGDGVSAVQWLRWLSPFGLVALTRPFGANRALPLLVLLVACGGLFAAVAVTAARRDVRGGWLRASSGRAPRLWLLGSVPGFAVRRALRPLAGWATAVGAYLLLIGMLAVSLTQFLTENPRFTELAGQAGFTGLGSVTGYVATMFALFGVPAGVFVAVRLASFAGEETDRRVTMLFAQPMTRTRLLAAETGAAAAGAAVLCLVAAVAAWAGAAAVGAGLGLAAALAGTVNVLPVVLLCLGAAVLALGWAPGAVAWIGSAPAVGGFLLLVIADSAGMPGWVRQLSPFAHLAAVPRTDPNWTAAAVMTIIAATLLVVGAVGYRRRDLIT
jgi:ABC-2 type transport system permease protein